MPFLQLAFGGHFWANEGISLLCAPPGEVYDRATAFVGNIAIVSGLVLSAIAGSARKSHRRLLKLERPRGCASDCAAALALKRDAERAKKLALRENKKLAKEVTQWVETAQGKFTENGGDAGDCARCTPGSRARSRPPRRRRRAA